MISRVVKQNHQEVYINTKAEFSLYVLEGILRHRLSQLRKIKRKLKKCLRKIRSFTRNKRDVKQLILEVCFLAKLERIYRSGLTPRDIFDRSFFYKPDDEVIRDLELLCNVFSERFIPLVNPASKVAYNPHFGAASAFVGGADADIIIDGTLYD